MHITDNMMTVLAVTGWVGAVNSLWWLKIGPREGERRLGIMPPLTWRTGLHTLARLLDNNRYPHSLTSWFLENREKHVKDLKPFNQDVNKSLQEICFFGQELGEPGKEPSIVVDFEAANDVSRDRAPIDVDVEVLSDDEEETPSIVLDWNQLKPEKSQTAIKIRDHEDDNLPSILVSDMEYEEVQAS